MALTESTMVKLGSKAPYFNLPNTDGENISLEHFKAEILVVIFTCNHCPYVIASESRIERMAERCRSEGLGFVGINSNDPIVYANDDWDHMIERAKSMSYPYLHDAEQKIAHAYGAQRTPEFYLLDASSKIIYRGRMDDSPRNPNAVSTNELDDAVTSLMSGNTVRISRTESIGCSVKWKA